MVMDIFSAILIVLPLIAPIAQVYGIDPYHLGVIFLLNLEVGYLTPPVGLNLFITEHQVPQAGDRGDVGGAAVHGHDDRRADHRHLRAEPDRACRRPSRAATSTALVQMVREQREAVSNVKEVTLPDGVVKKQAECAAVKRSRSSATTACCLFTDVTECRHQADAAVTRPAPRRSQDWSRRVRRAVDDTAASRMTTRANGGFEEEDERGRRATSRRGAEEGRRLRAEGRGRRARRRPTRPGGGGSRQAGPGAAAGR